MLHAPGRVPAVEDAGVNYPPIAEYAFLSDHAAAALVSKDASVDWCCMPRIDSGSTFGRLLDWERGGFCRIAPTAEHVDCSREYLDSTLVVATTFHVGGGVARVIDCLTVGEDARTPRSELLRIVEGIRGDVAFGAQVAPRFDYGDVEPWLRRLGEYEWSAIGGNDALVIVSDAELLRENHDLVTTFTVRDGERVRFSLRWFPPEALDALPPAPTPAELDTALERTCAWWQQYAAPRARTHIDDAAVTRSAIILLGLTHIPTGAIAAAATTSLPEDVGGSRNWDYRYSWIRDSQFTVRSLTELGFDQQAGEFRRFVERSAAGNVDSLRVLYGVGGERRVPELTLDELEGWRKSSPVRIGNRAAGQRQLDVYGYMLDLAWRWHERGHSPDDDYWRFLLSIVDRAASEWQEPDRGIWEVRGEPQHFVHSKALCWVAVDRGIRIAQSSLRQAPLDEWAQARDAIRQAIEREGYDTERGIFVRTFGGHELDSALLLLPAFSFVAYDDERMVRTTDAIVAQLDIDGLLRRYEGDDGIEGGEGAFVACSFWLAECYAHMGRVDDALTVFERAASTANDLGIFSEEYDPERKELLGNFPQALTHLSHIATAVAIARNAVAI